MYTVVGEGSQLKDYDPSGRYHFVVTKKALIVIGLVVAVVALLLVVTTTLSIVYIAKDHQDSEDLPTRPPKNLILMISDGCGPTSMTFARTLAGHTMPLDSILSGTVQTFSSNSLITDSAAGATAYACGEKTYNGGISVDPDTKKALGTILEAAQKGGMKTGLVVTSTVSHATPASFASHAVFRDMEDFIATQEVAHKVDVMLGGGRRNFDPNMRKDKLDLYARARELGYTVITTLNDFVNYRGPGPLLALFADGHMSYEIDRNPAQQPSLKQMTQKALDILNGDNQNGFFLMIEGSRIDMAAHDNDAAAHFHDIVAYNDAMSSVLAFAKASGNTLVLSVSDHETGGLALGINPRNGTYPDYSWEPSVIAKVTASADVMSSLIWGGQDAATVIKQYTGITIDSYDQSLIAAAKTRSSLLTTIGAIEAYHAGVGWSTWGHTAVDINLYSYGVGAELFRGNFDNTAVSHVIQQLFSWDVDEITKELVNFNTTDGSMMTREMLEQRIATAHLHD